VFIGANAMNIWHEYVAEGLYCDPSWVDLWLDSAGIATAMGLWFVLRNLPGRRSGKAGYISETSIRSASSSDES
jgi:hypothetical protein